MSIEKIFENKNNRFKKILEMLENEYDLILDIKSQEDIDSIVKDALKLQNKVFESCSFGDYHSDTDYIKSLLMLEAAKLAEDVIPLAIKRKPLAFSDMDGSNTVIKPKQDSKIIKFKSLSDKNKLSLMVSWLEKKFEVFAFNDIKGLYKQKLKELDISHEDVEKAFKERTGKNMWIYYPDEHETVNLKEAGPRWYSFYGEDLDPKVKETASKVIVTLRDIKDKTYWPAPRKAFGALLDGSNLNKDVIKLTKELLSSDYEHDDEKFVDMYDDYFKALAKNKPGAFELLTQYTKLPELVQKATQMTKEKTVKENSIAKRIIESTELAKAELVLASKSLVDDMQGVIEDLSKMQINSLPPVVDRIATINGLADAQSFESTVNEQIQLVLDTARSAKEILELEVYKLSGDKSDMDVANFKKTDIDVNVEAPEEDVDDFEGDDAAAGPKEEPLGRARKESKQTKDNALTESQNMKAFFLARHKPEDKQYLSKVFDKIDELVYSGKITTLEDLKKVMPDAFKKSPIVVNEIEEYFISCVDDVAFSEFNYDLNEEEISDEQEYKNNPHLKLGLNRNQLVQLAKNIRDIEDAPETDSDIEKMKSIDIEAMALLYPGEVNKIKKLNEAVALNPFVVKFPAKKAMNIINDFYHLKSNGAKDVIEKLAKSYKTKPSEVSMVIRLERDFNKKFDKEFDSKQKQEKIKKEAVYSGMQPKPVLADPVKKPAEASVFSQGQKVLYNGKEMTVTDSTIKNGKISVTDNANGPSVLIDQKSLKIVKEAKKKTPCTMEVETKSGKKRKKVFESKEAAKTWLQENKSAIKSVIKVY